MRDFSLLFLSEQAGRVKCPVDPYFIIPDRCVCVDFQTLRLQESPDAVPHGEMPRHMQLYCDRYACAVSLGNRVVWHTLLQSLSKFPSVDVAANVTF